VSDEHDPRGYIQAGDGGRFTQAMGDGTRVRLDVPDGEAGELRSLLGMWDAARRLLDAGAESGQAGQARRELGGRYESHVSAYGPVNRLDGPPPQGLPSQGGFRGDPYAPLVYALEHIDPDTGALCRAHVLTAQHDDPGAGIEPG